MQDKDIVQFTDTPGDEVNALIQDIKLVKLLQAVSNNDTIPEDIKSNIKNMIAFIVETFSISVPELDDDPMTTLRIISRDINLSRLLRERGYFRLYRMVTERVLVDPVTMEPVKNAVEDNTYRYVYWFQTIKDPSGRLMFKDKEDFIGWFCSNAHITRATAFMRVASISRVINMGKSIDEAFQLVLQRPFVVWKALDEIATWDGKNIKNINPDVAIALADKVMPERSDEIRGLAEAYRGDPERREELNDAMKPVISRMLDEVVSQPRAKESITYLKNDILGKPEVYYSWDPEIDCLIVEYILKSTNGNGVTVIEESIKVPFIPDVPELPDAIRKDLIKRLPIRNRESLT